MADLPHRPEQSPQPDRAERPDTPDEPARRGPGRGAALRADYLRAMAAAEDPAFASAPERDTAAPGASADSRREQADTAPEETIGDRRRAQREKTRADTAEEPPEPDRRGTGGPLDAPGPPRPPAIPDRPDRDPDEDPRRTEIQAAAHGDRPERHAETRDAPETTRIGDHIATGDTPDDKPKSSRIRDQVAKNSEKVADHADKLGDAVENLLSRPSPTGHPESRVQTSPGEMAPHHAVPDAGSSVAAVVSGVLVIGEIARRTRNKLSDLKES